jgi:hypothetical protein
MRMRTELFCAALALFVVGPGLRPQAFLASAAEPADAPFGRFTVEQLEAKIKEGRAGKLKLYIFDNNSQERFKQSHVPTARWIDYSRIRPSDLPKEKDATLVFYCANEH